jgi:protein SCO1/2
VLIGNEPGGQWMRNAATDNPRFMANMIGNWLNGWAASRPVTNAGANYEKASQIDLSDKGRYIFASQCAACHTIGHGDKIGPDLMGVTNVRDRKWLERFIATPDRVLAEKDPVALALFKKYKEVRMPNLNMAEIDLRNLVDFLERQSAQKDAPAAKEPGAATEKPAAEGEKIPAAKSGSGEPLR